MTAGSRWWGQRSEGQGQEVCEVCDNIKKEKTEGKAGRREGAIEAAPSFSVSLYDHLVFSLSAIR